MERLTKSEGKGTVMAVVDRFIKYIHFIILSYPFIAKVVAEIFLNYFYKFYGLPMIIITNRDKMFTNLF
jgi:hypothetical protein